jgi:5-methylcytosine-specific restriction enzyme subunit McrC
MKIKSIVVFEHESLCVGDGEGEISESEFDSLLRFHEKVDNKFFLIERRKIKFKHYVGIIQIGSLAIEVLPKVDKEDNSKSKWHDALLRMIKISKNIKSHQTNDAMVSLAKQSLLDVYFEHFLVECQSLIKSGLRKKYSFYEENLSTLKGKILFNQDLNKNSSNKAKIYCRHQVFDLNHDIHTALKMALMITKDVTRSGDVVAKAKALLVTLPDSIKSNISINKLERIKLDRTTKRYEKALNLATLIIKAYCPTNNSGAHSVIAFMFDMNKLYEEFVFKMARSALIDTEFEVLRKKKKFWEGKEIKPDIVITNGEKTIVIDTKWKVPKEGIPSDDDLKQIYVYNHYFNSPVSFLLYPKCKEKNISNEMSFSGRYHLPITVNGESVKSYCVMQTLELFNMCAQLDLLEIKLQIKRLVSNKHVNSFEELNEEIA